MAIFAPWYPKNGASGPLYPASVWDQVTIGGFLLPGRASIRSGGVKLAEDKKGSAGSNGALPTYFGIDPDNIAVVCTVWTAEQASKFAEVSAKLFGPNVKPAPVAISAQALNHLPIYEVVVKQVSEARVSGQIREFTIMCRHWLPSTVSKKKVVTSTPTKATLPPNLRAGDNNPAPSAQPNFSSPDQLQSF